MRRRARAPVTRRAMALGVAGVWGLLVALREFGVPPLGILLVAVIALEVASVLWGADSRDGRDWPRDREWGRWTRRSPERDAPPVSPQPRRDATRWPGPG